MLRYGDLPGSQILREAAPTFVFFVGFGHSGHSLIGAILDGHPDACIANEANYLSSLSSKSLPSKASAIAELTRSAAETLETQRWLNTGYSYRMEGSEQGICRRLCAVGDKKGGQTAELFAQNPSQLLLAKTLFGVDLRLISVIKNPYDVIAASAFRRSEDLQQKHVDSFFRKAKVVKDLRAESHESLFTLIRYEQFVANLEDQLARLLDFVGLRQDEGLIAAARGLIRVDIKPRRETISWPSGLKSYVGDLLHTTGCAELFEGYEAP